jgi:hypothetical protein
VGAEVEGLKVDSLTPSCSAEDEEGTQTGRTSDSHITAIEGEEDGRNSVEQLKKKFGGAAGEPTTKGVTEVINCEVGAGWEHLVCY